MTEATPAAVGGFDLGDLERPPGYDETRYVRAFADVSSALAQGRIRSGLEHFLQYGAAEGRLERLEYVHGWPVVDSTHFPACAVETVFWSGSGLVLVIGWIDDQDAALHSLSLMKHETLLGATTAIGRCRRQDVEALRPDATGRLLGFWSLLRARTEVGTDDIRVALVTASGQRAEAAVVRVLGDEALRDRALGYFAAAGYSGDARVAAFAQLDRGVGAALMEANTEICARIAAGAYCQRFGPEAGPIRASLVVCLFGRPEFMFLQAALFSRADWREYEFLYVCNSPELAERLFKEAALAARIYGLRISLVILPGNAGFGVANNVAAAHARSDRLIFINPDVFPRGDDWGRLHQEMVETLPAARTRLFGVPLYYADGSLMHGGMYFELDDGLAIGEAGVRRQALARVEHYGKGAPPRTGKFLRARAVPAVSGALISMARPWFERLGGFSADYVFGHYEDADLCLRSLEAGGPCWIHDLPFWHMEGHGGSRLPVHEGGALVNRWHFTRRWAATIDDGLLGPNPPRCPQDAA